MTPFHTYKQPVPPTVCIRFVPNNISLRVTLVCGSCQARSSVLNSVFFFFQAEDGIRDAQESRGLGDVYKRQDY